MFFFSLFTFTPVKANFASRSVSLGRFFMKNGKKISSYTKTLNNPRFGAV